MIELQTPLAPQEHIQYLLSDFKIWWIVKSSILQVAALLPMC